jgi:NTP pyrophosphatase (non-canonical NTP hydrolase)
MNSLKEVKRVLKNAVVDDVTASLGLAGEAGEVCSIFQKFREGKTASIDMKHLHEELGDALCYLTIIANAHGFSLADIANRNLAKIKARHGG